MTIEKIRGITYPIPTEYAERIYNEGKTVFVAKRCLCKASNGDKFIIYESWGAKAYTGWAEIKTIGKQKTDTIFRKYGKKLMITKKELYEYAKGNPEMAVIEFKTFEKFKKPVKPLRFVTVAGKYIDENEYNMIIKDKD